MAIESEKLTEKIIAAAIEVHSRLSPGFLESIYENALVIELKKRNLKVKQQYEVVINYDGFEIGRHRIDLFVNDVIIIELKNIENIHYAIVKSYLRALNNNHGLILNFSKEKQRKAGNKKSNCFSLIFPGFLVSLEIYYPIKKRRLFSGACFIHIIHLYLLHGHF